MGELLKVLCPAVSAGASAKVVDMGVIPAFESTDNAVNRITIVSPTTQATQGATNFVTIQVRQIPLSTGTPGTPVVLASHNLGTTALTADTPVNLTLPAIPISNLKAGDVIDVYALQTGTGGAVAVSTEIQLELE